MGEDEGIPSQDFAFSAEPTYGDLLQTNRSTCSDSAAYEEVVKVEIDHRVGAASSRAQPIDAEGGGMQQSCRPLLAGIDRSASTASTASRTSTTQTPRVMLPGSAIFDKCSYVGDQPAWILGPGNVVVTGDRAVCAGLHHQPDGYLGLGAGFVAGTLFGGIPLLVLPAVGYQASKAVARTRHTISMRDENGLIVRVKLWKAGKHAPLTEDGYWLVASDARDSEMEVFIRRVLAKIDVGPQMHAKALSELAKRYGGSEEVFSLASLMSELRETSNEIS